MIVYISLAGALVYFFYLLLAAKGYNVVKDPERFLRCFVSVVIAARNEAKNMPELLLRLKNQNYPAGEYEVIVVNDGSDDGTEAIVKRFAKDWPSLTVIDTENRETAVSKKKNALQQGIKAARGELILLTDADCLPGPKWITSTIKEFHPGVDMVVGFSGTELSKKHNIFSSQWFEHFDFLTMFAMAGGLILQKKYFSCSGQNLAYRRSAWEEVGGFERISHIISGDDVNLMQLFRQAGKGITFNLSSSGFMRTAPQPNWFALLNQRSRWASNTGFQLKLNPEFFVYLLSVLIVTFFPWIMIGMGLQKYALLIIALRFIFEISFLKKTFKLFKEPDRRIYSYPVWFILQPVYILIAAVFGFGGFFIWKK